MNISSCPVVHAFLAYALPLLPEFDEDVIVGRAAAECFGHPLSHEVECARARHLTEYAAVTCLPRGFDMFSLPLGRTVLSGLPSLRAETFAVYATALQGLAERDWQYDSAGGTLMHEALLRPVNAVRNALALLLAEKPAEAVSALDPVIERLSGSEELLPLLDALLLITPAHPNGRPKREVDGSPGLSFGGGMFQFPGGQC
jgi:hypothetical protein